MSFVAVPGLKGKVYVPDEPRPGLKKHRCRDCFSCQQCSDDRCRVCRGVRPCNRSKQLKLKKMNPELLKGIGCCGVME